MLKDGQIEDKEAGEMKAEIDSKMYWLSMNAPEIELVSHKQRIIQHSDLASIFEHEELESIVNKMKNFKEELHPAKNHMVIYG